MFIVIVVTVCIILLLAVETSGSCSPCYCSGTIVFCGSRQPKLTEIPDGLPTKATELYLGSNNIASLNMTRLETLTALTFLDVNHNRLTDFDLSESQLPRLEKLHLYGNAELRTVNIHSSSLSKISLSNTAVTCLSRQNFQTPNLHDSRV